MFDDTVYYISLSNDIQTITWSTMKVVFVTFVSLLITVSSKDVGSSNTLKDDKIRETITRRSHDGLTWHLVQILVDEQRERQNLRRDFRHMKKTLEDVKRELQQRNKNLDDTKFQQKKLIEEVKNTKGDLMSELKIYLKNKFVGLADKTTKLTKAVAGIKTEGKKMKAEIKRNYKNGKKIQSMLINMKSKVKDLDDESSKKHPSGAVYIRWGKLTCPNNTDLIYKGRLGGTQYQQKAGPSNFQCLPDDPDYKEHQSGDQGTFIYGGEYELHDYSQKELLDKRYFNYDVVCSVCQSRKNAAKIMIPGKTSCYNGWHMEYRGYLMAGHYGHAASNFICVDAHPDVIPGTNKNDDQSVIYAVQSICGSLKCPPYKDYHELTCVCLPEDPDYKEHQSGDQGTYIYGGEYELSSHTKKELLNKRYYNYEVVCSTCQSRKNTATIMIPGKSKCYDGWHIEYRGYLMAGHSSHAASNFICVDAYPDVISGTNKNDDQALIYAVQSICGRQLGGTYHGDKAGPSNFQCLPEDPDYREYQSGDHGTLIYGGEYQLQSYYKKELLNKGYYNFDVVCSVCQCRKNTATIMIPGKSKCYDGWHIEYRGYLMAGHSSHAASHFICVDSHPDVIPGTIKNDDQSVIYAVQSRCGRRLGGTHYSHKAGPSNYQCLPEDPDYREHQPGDQGTYIYGGEYELSSYTKKELLNKRYYNYDVVCSACQSRMNTATIMIPGKSKCYDGWHREYRGYLMAGYNSHTASNYICVDAHPDVISGTNKNDDQALIYAVQSICGSLKCPPYKDNHELTCVINYIPVNISCITILEKVNVMMDGIWSIEGI
ncbi:hypothetical protein KUTeg_011058 [Tegillarca granosa]|uniref:Uncharacterized protein n=1 Tax=Tegillarca granosa TaxID=220873 RepID=A0ABQ9F2S9_TEGGR|nr:hypothetical protein KUTeg_011058 [Tegillarca granosa]